MGSPVPLGRKREEARTTDDDGRISSKLTNFLLGQNICCTVPLNSGTMNISIHARRCWSDQSLANLPLLQFVQCPSLPANRNRERERANERRRLKKPSFIHSLLSRSPSLSCRRRYPFILAPHFLKGGTAAAVAPRREGVAVTLLLLSSAGPQENCC